MYQLRAVTLGYRITDPIQLGGPRSRPPKADEVALRFSPEGVHELEALKTHYPTLKSCILPGLWLAQREYGRFLSGEAIAREI